MSPVVSITMGVKQSGPQGSRLAMERVGEVDLRPHTHTCTHSPTFCSPVCTKYTYTLCTQYVQCNAYTVIIAEHDAYMTHTLLVDVKSSKINTSSMGLALGVDFFLFRCSIASVFFWRISCNFMCVRSWRVIIPTTCMGRSKGCFFNRGKDIPLLEVTLGDT